MIGDSKILTVSYGTFSCTLEGFDDPLNTMKAIAEYFRDLASDDRYFGAEPPTPDAAMLHRIAEREVSRMVEARVQDNSVFLRQHDAAPAPQVAAPVAPVVAPVVAAPVSQPPVSQPPVTATEAPAPAMEAPPAPAPLPAFPQAETFVAPKMDDTPDLPVLHDVIPGGVAAKLARIRQSVTVRPAPATTEDQPAPALAQPDEPAVERTAEPDHAPLEDVMVGDAAHATVEEDTLPETFMTAPADEELPEDAAAYGAFDEATPEEVYAAEVGPAEEGAAEISAELSVSDDASAVPVAASATAGDSYEDSEDAARVDDALARLGVLLSQPEETESAEPPQVALSDMASLDDADDAATNAAAAPEPAAAPVALLLLSDALVEDDEVDLDTLRDLASLDGAEVAADVPLPVEDTTALDQPLAAGDHDAVAADEMAYAGTDLADEPAVAEIEAAVGDDAPQAADDLGLADLMAADDTSDDADDEPKRANARVIRIRRADSEDGDDDSDLGIADDPTRPFDSAGEAAAMSRLMRQADDEMAGAENRRRLSAIAHLKAAVAATEAERAVTGEALSSPTTKIGPYRDDLAHAVQPEEAEPTPPVRPRRDVVSVRPEGPRPGAIRPGIMNAPPLVLVSEQRIDRTPPAGQPMVALRPGRLSGAIGATSASLNAPVAEDQYSAAIAEFEDDEDFDTDNIFSDDAGFVQFVATLGVTSLTERMEAAAAFACIVENRESFTRPQLMRRLTAGTTGMQLSREDGLRSFGTLLRTGRIEKVRRGQYTLSSESPYLAEARRLAL